MLKHAPNLAPNHLLPASQTLSQTKPQVSSQTNLQLSSQTEPQPQAKALYIMRSPSGCGKSQFTAQHFPPTAIISPDDIRFNMTATPYHHASDDDRKAFEAEVWTTVFQRIADLMDRGEPNICFDATNCRTGHLPQYQQLAEEHGYRVYVIDMTDVPFAECLKRNAERRGQRRVPYKVIERQFDDAITHAVPAGINALTPAQAAKLLAQA